MLSKEKYYPIGFLESDVIYIGLPGNPKGVMLTHENIVSNVSAAYQQLVSTGHCVSSFFAIAVSCCQLYLKDS